MEEAKLEGAYEEIAKVALNALELAAQNEIELTTITRDTADGDPIAACVLVVGPPNRVREILLAIHALEETWEDEPVDETSST